MADVLLHYFEAPVTLWPVVERRVQLPTDVEELVATFEDAV